MCVSVNVRRLRRCICVVMYSSIAIIRLCCWMFVSFLVHTKRKLCKIINVKCDLTSIQTTLIFFFKLLILVWSQMIVRVHALFFCFHDSYPNVWRTIATMLRLGSAHIYLNRSRHAFAFCFSLPFCQLMTLTITENRLAHTFSAVYRTLCNCVFLYVFVCVWMRDRENECVCLTQRQDSPSRKTRDRTHETVCILTTQYFNKQMCVAHICLFRPAKILWVDSQSILS